MSTSPRIYVASLSDYNSGRLHGAWIDAAQDPSDIQAEIFLMLKASPTNPRAEEWAIHDHEGFEGAKISEHMSVYAVSELAKFLEETEEAGGAWLANGMEPDLDAFQDAYQGTFDDIEAYAHDLLENTGELESIPEHLRPYFDVEFYGEDLIRAGEIWTARTSEGLAVFSNH